MNIRKALEKDTKRLLNMLFSVQQIHADGRPDIFIKGARKYSENDVKKILSNDNTPVFVVVDENDVAIGYAFCQMEKFSGTANLSPRKIFYIDDLCIDSAFRGRGLGTALYNYVVEKAREYGCYHLTLNVWHLNESAMRFYNKLGMKPLKSTMEQIL